jgi:pinin/SDK/memA/ protein conserved region
MEGGMGENEKSASPADSPTDRRKSGQLEERKRGQRLFGALLGTLSQSSSSAAQRRRADIEKKQQAKLKLQAEEYDQKKKKELEELTALRKQEQRKFDEQSVSYDLYKTCL